MTSGDRLLASFAVALVPKLNEATTWINNEKHVTWGDHFAQGLGPVWQERSKTPGSAAEYCSTAVLPEGQLPRIAKPQAKSTRTSPTLHRLSLGEEPSRPPEGEWSA